MPVPQLLVTAAGNLAWIVVEILGDEAYTHITKSQRKSLQRVYEQPFASMLQQVEREMRADAMRVKPIWRLSAKC